MGESEKAPSPDLSNVEPDRDGESLQLHEQAGTKRNVKSRHAQMIAIGGVIGTGLFLGTGQALAIGGPGNLFIAYIIMALLVYGVVTAVIEVSTFLPVSGASMAYYGGRFVSPSLGFAMGWLYFYSFGMAAAYEITAASIVINYWQNDVSIALWITIMLVVVVGLNFSPVAVYAEAEFWFASIKIIMLVGLLILSLVIMLGGGPEQGRIGFRYWNDPGSFNTFVVDGDGGRFTAFLYILIFSGFSFYFGPELMVFTAGEMRNPRKNLPTASSRFFWRLILFYVLGALAIGIICQSNSDGLTSGAFNANASPWVIGIQNAGIAVLPSIINAGILTSAWSSGNADLYMSSRALYSLAVAGKAPKVFTRCTGYGLPIFAVLGGSLFMPLAYLSCGSQAGTVFNWFISLTNTAGYTSWIMCCFIFQRFRKACQRQNVSVPYQSHIQPWGSYISMSVLVVLLLCNGFTLFYPGNFTASGFLTTYLGIPVFWALYFAHKLTAGRKDAWLYRAEDVDLTTNVREIDADAQMWAEVEAEEKGRKVESNVVWRKISLLWQ